MEVGLQNEMILKNREAMGETKRRRSDGRIPQSQCFRLRSAIPMMGNLAINVTTDGFLIDFSATASKISSGPERRHSIPFQPIRKDKRELSRDITFESLYRLRNGLIGSKADQEANVINSNLAFKKVIFFAFTDLLKGAIY